MENQQTSIQDTLIQHIKQYSASSQAHYAQIISHLRSATATAVTTALLSLLQQHRLHVQSLAALSPCLLISSSTLPTLFASEKQPLLLYTSYDVTALQPQQAQSIAITLLAIEQCRGVLDDAAIPLIWLLDGTSTPDATLHTLMEHYPLLRQARGCLWDGTGQTGIDLNQPQLALGSKGLLRVALEVQTASQPIHRQHSAIVPDAFWRLTWALGEIKNMHAEVLLPGFYEAVRSPEEAELVSLHLLPDTGTQLARRWGMKQLLFDLHGFQLHYIHLLMPDCTLIDIQGRQQETVAGSQKLEQCMDLPRQARALLEFVLVPDQQPETILQALRLHLNEHSFDDITIQVLFARPPAITALQHPFAHQVWQCSTQIYGDRLILLPLTAGSLPLGILPQMYNIPCVLITLGNEAWFEESLQQIAVLIGGTYETYSVE